MEFRILERLRQFKSNFDETKLMYGLSAVVFVCALGLLGFFVYQYLNIQYPISNISNYTEQIKTCTFHRALDGVCVSSVEKTNPNLIAIMIENHHDARPQSGLADASVVYEAPVEANYTRFMAIYPADAVVSEVGPVRSARPYYLDWLAEYGNPMYMHCGGSPVALQKITAEKVNDLNEMYNGKYFWRDNIRPAPHNLYTSSELWKNRLQDTSYTLQEGWKFSTTTKQQSNEVAPVNNVVINFLAPDYIVEWKYNSSTQKYERWQAGIEHRELDGTLITSDTVIVQHVKTRVLDEVGRLSMETIGSGAVEVYFDGARINGKWIKTDRTSRTRFYDSSGGEIKLKPGKIWIEIINK